MKLHTILLAGTLLLTPQLSTASELSDVTALMEAAKSSTSENRFELINQIKEQIATLNEGDRATAIAQMQASRADMQSNGVKPDGIQGRPAGTEGMTRPDNTGQLRPDSASRPDGATRPDGIQGRPAGTEGMTRPDNSGQMRPEGRGRP
jgi:hypothetical protein